MTVFAISGFPSEMASETPARIGRVMISGGYVMGLQSVGKASAASLLRCRRMPRFVVAHGNLGRDGSTLPAEVKVRPQLLASVSGVRRNLCCMTDEFAPSDRLFYSIKEIRGWYEVLTEAQDAFYGVPPARANVGRLISTLLLAGGEDADPVAVCGHMDDERSGRLIVVHQRVIVVADVSKLNRQEAEMSVRVWPHTAVTDLSLSTRHNYFDGTERHKRTQGVSVRFSIGPETFTIDGSNTYRRSMTPLQDDAIYTAYLALRDATSR